MPSSKGVMAGASGWDAAAQHARPEGFVAGPSNRSYGEGASVSEDRAPANLADVPPGDRAGVVAECDAGSGADEHAPSSTLAHSRVATTDDRRFGVDQGDGPARTEARPPHVLCPSSPVVPRSRAPPRRATAVPLHRRAACFARWPLGSPVLANEAHHFC